MRTLNLLLALAVAAPLRAAVLGEAARGAADLPLLPVSAISVSAAAPALLAPNLLSAPVSSDPLDAAGAAETPAAVPAASPAEAAAAATSANGDVVAHLHRLFSRLDAEYPLPDGSPAAAVRARVRAQLLSAAHEYSEPESSLLEAVAAEADRALARIQQRLEDGDIHPNRTIRLSESDPDINDDTHARVGVYPVAADPFQWGHLLIALRAVGELGVDKIVFVLAGDDPRKPTMTPVVHRHPMGREVLDVFAPFFAYSPIAVGTTLDGETNIFRILALNPDRRVDAWYMVGDDHYRRVDKKGNPDTLPKLEANYASAMGHSPTLHALKVAFIKREGPADQVPTPLDVRFLDHVGFDASSTMVRGGRHSLMPYAAYDYARRNVPGLYSLTPDDDADPMKN
jgi:hypothetical protein